MVSVSAVQQGQLHRYSKRLVAFEHSTPTGHPSNNIILWVGGLGDGIHTVAYPSILSQRLPAGWSLAQVQLLSALNGWGTGSLQRDAKEIAQCVDYFRKQKGDGSKIVVMGHSTGCQDVMEYVTGPGHQQRPQIDGAVLQAPVSDREGLANSMPDESRTRILQTAEEYCKNGRANDPLPASISGSFLGRIPISAYRWLSLLSIGGDDDYFSSDLPDERLRATFGGFPPYTPLLILFSGADEHVPTTVDVQALFRRWKQVVQNSKGVLDGSSGIIQGAHHNLNNNDEDVVQDLVRRVVDFVTELNGSITAKLT